MSSQTGGPPCICICCYCHIEGFIILGDLRLGSMYLYLYIVFVCICCYPDVECFIILADLRLGSGGAAYTLSRRPGR